MAGPEKKSLNSPDEVRSFDKGMLQISRMDSGVVGRVTFNPGWKWSESVKPIAGTESCQVDHFSYQISGKMVVKMNDGTETELNPGDAVHIPPGHDAWVVGDEPVVMVGFNEDNYAKPSE
ncbi:MAG: cupin domain-containing protein [Actinomycetota bacterium]